MVYAKKMANGTVENLITYDYQPKLDKNDGVVIISKEEYDNLMSQLREETVIRVTESNNESGAAEIGADDGRDKEI